MNDFRLFKNCAFYKNVLYEAVLYKALLYQNYYSEIAFYIVFNILFSNFQIIKKTILCISLFWLTDWIPKIRSRFYNPNCKQYHKSSAAIRRNNQPATGSRVYRDSSYFKFLAKKFVNSEHSSDNFIELLNASELAKSRKTWPFFSESCL